MSYSIESLAADCYEGTSVLINKLDIRNEKELNDYESFVTGFKMIYLLQQNMKPNFDFEDYKAIHRELFSDLYEWAGTTRNLNLSKQGTNFCSYEKIDDLGNRIFSRLKRLNYLVDLERDKFVCEIADLYDTINRLHPFREGNGRTQRVFFYTASQQCWIFFGLFSNGFRSFYDCYYIRFTRCDRWIGRLF